MEKTYKDPIETIHHSIRTGDYDALSDALDHIYSTGRRSTSVKSALVFGYTILANEYGHSCPYDAFRSHERMRQLSKEDKELLKNELGLLTNFANDYKGQLDEHSIELILKMMKYICNNVPKSYVLTAKRFLEKEITKLPIPKSNVERSYAKVHLVQSMAKYLFTENSNNTDGISSVEYYCTDCELFYFDGVHEYTSDFLQLAYTKSSVKCPECGTTSGKYITQGEFADRTGLSINTVRKWTSTGRIHKTYFGRSVRIPESEIERIAVHIPSVYE